MLKVLQITDSLFIIYCAHCCTSRVFDAFIPENYMDCVLSLRGLDNIGHWLQNHAEWEMHWHATMGKTW